MANKNPDYINFMNAGIEPHLIPGDNHLYCNQCNNQGYVSDEEMQFLKDNKHITNNHILIPVTPKVNAKSIESAQFISPWNRRENIYVSTFCPKCDREKFGEHSNWRE